MPVKEPSVIDFARFFRQSWHCMLLSHRHPLIYSVAVGYHRLRRRLAWMRDRQAFAARHPVPLPCLVKRHSSRLIKVLGDSDRRLQENKVVNLTLIAPLIDSVTIRPGEVFSFCRLVGKPTRRRGFLEGMELSMGKARSGVGGGICQMANLLNWLVLHSCAVFYNYVDFAFRNDTAETFQLKIWLTETDLWGELRSATEIAETYKIYEERHRFLKRGELFFRSNEIWRRVMERKTGKHLRDEKIKENFVRVMYVPETWEEE
jgi:vancomycin resistance protein VanW